MDVRLNSSFSKGVFDNLAILQQYLPGYAPNPHRKSMASVLQNVILLIALTGGALLTTEEK